MSDERPWTDNVAGEMLAIGIELLDELHQMLSDIYMAHPAWTPEPIPEPYYRAGQFLDVWRGWTPDYPLGNVPPPS